jgi:hypothetical protein
MEDPFTGKTLHSDRRGIEAVLGHDWGRTASREAVLALHYSHTYYAPPPFWCRVWA